MPELGLRVGLTGGLGSGKSSVAAIFRELGAEVIEADELGRALMEPGQTVFSEIVQVFGAEVIGPDGRLDRAKLADLAFRGGRLNDLNAIVHPAVIAAQKSWMERVFVEKPGAIAVVESALIFEVERDARLRGESEGVLADWRRRFDCVVLVVAPDEVKIARYVARVAKTSDAEGSERDNERIAADARSRLARQMSDAEKQAKADFVIENTADLAALRIKVKAVWHRLLARSNKTRSSELLQSE